MNRQNGWRFFLAAGVPVSIFLGAALPNLDLPGIQYDEVYYVPPVAALLKNQPEADYVMLDPSVIHLFDRPLPLIFNYYTSFFRAYLTLPVFAILGISVETIRGSSIALGAVALIFFVAFARRLLRDSRLAFASGILLALDASFIAYIRNDFAVVATMMALKGVALWALLRWWQGAENKYLYLGYLFIGLGITDRASFLWIPMAIASTMALIYGRTLRAEIWQRLRSLKTAYIASVFFACGASIFLAFNLATPGGTFAPMLSNFGNTFGGANNFAFFENLFLRLQMLTEVLGGSYLNHFILGDSRYQTAGWNFSGSPLSWLVPLAFIYFVVRAVIGLFHKSPSADEQQPKTKTAHPAVAGQSRKEHAKIFQKNDNNKFDLWKVFLCAISAPLRLCVRFLLFLQRFVSIEKQSIHAPIPRPLIFIMLMNVFLLILSCFTPTLHRGHQLLMLYPFPHFLVALFAFDLVKLFARPLKKIGPQIPSVVALTMIFLICAGAIRPVLGYHQMLRQTGGRGAWSEAIYEIVDELERNPEQTVVCMDWGFNANILSLAQKPIKTIRNYYDNARRSPEQLAKLFDARHVFLFHSPEHTLLPAARDDFARAVALSNAKVDTLRIFYQREGQPMAFLLSAQGSAVK